VDSSKRLPLELLAKPVRDSLGNGIVPSPEGYRSEAQPSDPVDDKQVGFCGHLFEIPALRGVDIQQVVAGDRTSFVMTRRDGRVLGWGANEYGQLGLGANVTLPSISVPTEIVLSMFTEKGTVSRCTGIAAGTFVNPLLILCKLIVRAGGDLTFFTVERELPNGGSIVDVLACGNGQWGGLGNAAYSNAQGIPVKVKSVSGVLEC
jgi:alpha-tubulin suppressor-like RCC1 family protein